MFSTTYTQIDRNPVYRDDYLYRAGRTQKRKKGKEKETALLYLHKANFCVCISFRSEVIVEECSRTNRRWPRFELTRLAPSRGRAREERGRVVTDCGAANPMSPPSTFLPRCPTAVPSCSPPPPNPQLAPEHLAPSAMRCQDAIEITCSSLISCSRGLTCACTCVEINNPTY